MLLMAGNGCRFAHRGFRDMIDHSRTNKYNKQVDSRQMRQMGPGGGHFMFQGPMSGMRGGMGMGPGRMGRMSQMMGRPPMHGMRGFMGHRPINGMRRGMGPRAFMGQGPMRPDWMIDRIPNLTDKQKKDIADLRQKQQDEMKKFIEDMSVKMKAMRESDRNNVLNLLTDEQKKSIESNSGNMNPLPVKAK